MIPDLSSIRSSYPPRLKNYSIVPFELVHSDVQGPCRVSSIRGFRYFIMFVDDFTRMTWVYLMKDRTQVYDVIKIFFNEILIQFSTPLCVFCTDNALAYMQRDASLLCESQGILHHMSCPQTSQ